MLCSSRGHEARSRVLLWAGSQTKGTSAHSSSGVDILPGWALGCAGAGVPGPRLTLRVAISLGGG